MNNYARLSEVKRLSSGLNSTELDAVYLDAIEAASREFELRCHRHFYSKTATRYFDGNGKRNLRLTDESALLSDLLSITSLTVDDDDDGTYELTMVDGTDYRLWPLNESPKTRIDLLTRGTQLSVWPKGQSTVKLVGKFGYSEDTESSGLTGTVATTNGTTLTASDSATGVIEKGDTILIGTEQMYVSAVEGTAITVTRGVNGTTAATHSAVAINIRRYPKDIEDIIAKRVAGHRIGINQLTPLGESTWQAGSEFAEYMAVVKRYAYAGGLVVR